MPDPTVPELSDDLLVDRLVDSAMACMREGTVRHMSERFALRLELLRRLQESHALRLAVAAHEEGMAGVVAERNELRKAVKELRAALCCIFGPEWPTDEEQERAEALYERTKGLE